MTLTVSSPSDLYKALYNNQQGLNVVKMFSPTCPACQSIQKAFENLAKQNPDIQFVCVNINKSPKLADEFQIDAIPTFLIFEGTQLADIVVGANMEELSEKL